MSLVSTAAPTRSPETTVLELLRATPRCCGSSRDFDASETWFYIDRSVLLGILLVSGAALVSYGVWAVCRRCFWCCQRPSHVLGKRELHVSFRQRVALASFVAFLAAGFAVGTIVAQQPLARALRLGASSSDGLSDKFDVVDDLASQLSAASDAIGELAAAAVCADPIEKEALVASAQLIDDSTDSVQDYTDDARVAARRASRSVARARGWVDGVLLLTIIVVLLLLPWVLYGTALSRRWAITASSRQGFALCVVLSIVVAFEFGLAVKLADFCKRPDRNFVDLLEERVGLKDDSLDLVVYYVSCDGVNPLADDIAAARTGAVALNATLARVDCTPDAVIDELQRQTLVVIDLIDALVDAIACPPINDDYASLLRGAVCNRFLTGLYAVAVVHAVVAALLYLFLYAANYVNETILLEEEFWLMPHPEVFALSGYNDRDVARQAQPPPNNIQNNQEVEVEIADPTTFDHDEEQEGKDDPATGSPPPQGGPRKLVAEVHL